MRRGAASLLAAAAFVAACGCGEAGGAWLRATGSAGAAGNPTAERTSTPAVAPPGADWPTFGGDAARTGSLPGSSGIRRADLAHLRRQIVSVDGTVDSAPIELHGVRVAGRVRDTIVGTTTYGRTFALDARTGRRLWEYTPPSFGAVAGSAQVTNTTPVSDPDRRTVYAASPDGRIRKLVLATGSEVRSGGWPVRVTDDATHEKLAAALTVSGGLLIAETGGYIGDAPPYQGHVVTIERATGRIVHVFNSLCSDRARIIVPSSCRSSDSAIWARAGAVVEPGSGRLLLATGNGPFNGRTDWGDSVLELAPDAGRLLHNWTPTNESSLESSDTDVGSTAPALLAPYGGRHLAVQGGKDGRLHLLDTERLDGGRSGPSRRLGGEVGETASPGATEVLTQPAVWRGLLFVADDSATAAYALAGRPAHPFLRQVWEQARPGTSPVVAGGLLYVYDPNEGRLVVRDPRTGHELAILPAQSGHWNSPIVAGGRIILPTGSYHDHATSGKIDIWRVPGA